MAKDSGWGLHTERFPQQEFRHLPVFIKELIAGGVAGGLSKTCVAPLERVKILFQTGRMANNSISQTLAAIAREEGPLGWYRGNGASVLRIVPYAAFNFGAYEQYRALLARHMYGSEAETHSIPPVFDLLAGSAAGGTAVLMTYPLDLVRTRLAYGSERSSGGGLKGGSGTMQASPKTGVLPSSTGMSNSSSSRSGIVPATSSTASNMVQPAVASANDGSPAGRLSSNQYASSSGRGSVVYHLPLQGRCGRSTLYNSNTREAGDGTARSSGNVLHARPSMSPKATIRSVLAETLNMEGLAGLYRGIGPTLLGIVPYAGLKFYMYQSMKQNYWTYYGDHDAGGQVVDVSQAHHQRLPVLLMLSFGALAGVVAQTVTYPLDVVRRHMQVQSLREGRFAGMKFTSTWNGITTISRQKGVRALFSGLSINYLKVVPSTAIGFTIYDAAKHYLDLPQNL